MKFKIPFLPSKPSVAVIKMSGVISSGARGGLSDQTLGPILEKAFKKGQHDAVALLINSPGGSPVQSSLISSRVQRLAEENDIPVYAFIEDVAASGGYWLACAANEIYADNGSIIGSIGVISSGFGFEGLINKYGGLVSIMPRYAIVFMVFTLGALGLPGTTGFIGEFLILMGAFEKNILVAMIASLGVILGAAYMLWLFKRVVFGEMNNQDLKNMKDLKTFEIITLSALVIPILFFGFYPEPLMNSIESSVENTLNMYNFDLINNLASKD